jgi:hypothetical protein
MYGATCQGEEDITGFQGRAGQQEREKKEEARIQGGLGFKSVRTRYG